MRSIEFGPGYYERLENKEKFLISLIEELAEEFLPKGTEGQYFGLTPKQRNLAQKVNNICEKANSKL